MEHKLATHISSIFLSWLVPIPLSLNLKHQRIGETFKHTISPQVELRDFSKAISSMMMCIVPTTL